MKKTRSKRAILKKMLLLLAIVIGLAVIVEGFLLWRLQQQRDNYKQYWAKRAQEPIANNALWYVALGDSTAVGIGASRPEKSYVGLFAEYLAKQSGRPVHVVNLGVSGAKVQDVIDAQLPKLQSLNLPADAVITVDIGSNDMRRFNEQTFQQQFEELVRQLPKQTIVGNIPYFGPDYHGHGGKQAKQANLIVEALLKTYSLRLANVYIETENHNSLTYYAADFFHPNDKSYRSWFDAFKNAHIQ